LYFGKEPTFALVSPQGFKCTQCKLLIHKKCHKLIRVGCDATQVAALPPHGRQQSTGSGSGSGASAGERQAVGSQGRLGQARHTWLTWANMADSGRHVTHG
jgi:hypothetical protein